MSNFSKFLSTNSLEYLDKVAIVTDFDTITYKQLTQQSRQFATTLRDLNVQPGDRVILMLEDCVEWVVAWLAINQLGAVPVHISNRLAVDRLANIINTSRAKVAIFDTTVDALRNVFKDQTLLGKQDIMSKNQEHQTYYEFDNDEICLWALTSGTGGAQKIIAHRHASIHYTIDKISKAYNITSDSVLYSIPKLSFMFGFFNMLAALAQNATEHISNQVPNPAAIRLRVREYSATHLYSVPSILAMMNRSTSEPTTDLATVKVLLCGGEVLPITVVNEFRAKFGVDILDGHGMSEVQHMTISQTPNDIMPGTIGRPLEGVLVEIRRPDGSPCDISEVGELYIKDPSIALCYINDWELTKDTFVGRWLKTNDLVYQRPDGYYVFSARNGDIVKVNGEKVSLIEVENVLLTHDQIEDCVMLKSNDTGFTKLTAQIILKKDNELSAGSVRRYLRDRLESYKIPKYIEFVDTINKTVTAKKIRVRV
jgi:benzoate-CoA ligase